MRNICIAVRLLLIFMILSSLSTTVCAAGGECIYTVEAESGVLNGNAKISGGKKVGNLGTSGNSYDSTVSFNNVNVPEDGFYLLKIYYMSGSDDRYFSVKINSSEYKVDCPDTGGFEKTGSVGVEIYLNDGDNIIVFGSPWYAPDLDKIEIYKAENKMDNFSNRDERSFKCRDTEVICDVNNGIYSIIIDGVKTVSDAKAVVLLKGESELLYSNDFPRHSVESSEINDKFGGGLIVTFTHSDKDCTMIQTFRIPEDESFVLTELTVSGTSISTNYIAPLAGASKNCLKNTGSEYDSFLQIPYDNDAWTEPVLYPLSTVTVSHEVAALIDTQTNAGVVIGSVTHDTWKTGMDITAVDGIVFEVSVFGGAADGVTRDTSPHGYVSGTSVCSPKIFIGRYDDWREGMNKFAEANTIIVPRKVSVSETVPFGFNSWGVMKDSVSFSELTDVSDFVAQYLQKTWSGENGDAVYINIDSFWDFIVHNDKTINCDLDTALSMFVSYCHKNGQKAGIYFTPFTAWQGDESSLKRAKVEGIDGNVSYYDIALRNSDGTSLYGKLDGGYALDPTHPVTLQRAKNKFDYFISLGFEYVKLDFMAHGALEGSFYADGITTGTQAYNYAMNYINECIGEKMFINLSIAPVFPYQYADGRRMSCDAWSSIDNTRHVLSYVTYCFFEKLLYTYTDPDHIVVWGEKGDVPFAEARSRVTSGVIAGTSFLCGDNLGNPAGDKDAAIERFVALLGNKDIIEVAKKGVIFEPYSVGGGEKCADIYMMRDGNDTYLAMFNFKKTKRTVKVDLSNLGLFNNAHELWRNIDTDFNDNILKFELNGYDSAIFKLIVQADTNETENAETDTVSNNPANDGIIKGSDMSAARKITVGACLIALVCFAVFGAVKLLKRK